ncbi:methyltransferase [Hyphococcus sp.]|jgi:acetylserotonin N-methyltransferase|uniref:methyltransferase n=1 Tax=Hyphococcus sp. TaxID=2038636 RepID=UPI003D0F2FDA
MSVYYEAPPVDDRAIWDLWLSQHYFPAATAAQEAGIFEALAKAPMSLEDLASKLSLNKKALGVVMSLIAALGLAACREGVWRLTPHARTYLLADATYSWSPLFDVYKNGTPFHGELLALLKTGETTRTDKPSDNWEAGKVPPDAARSIAKFMHSHSLPAAVAAARSGAFKDVNKFLDVGGGSGVFAIAAAQRNPGLKATIMDLDTMCDAAQELFVSTSGVEDRVETLAVDMFREDWPTGYDALFFSNIFHDWDEEINAKLSKKAFDALPSGGRIFLHEILMNDNEDGPLTPASFSVLMLRGTKGKQYTLRELTSFLEGAEFKNVAAIETSPYYSLVSAQKP